MSQKKLNLQELKSWCRELASTFSKKQIILLSGELGAGKTQFVQYVVEALGGGESSSPTFSVINEYKINRGLVHHIDLYRLESEEELESVGFWDLFSSDEGLIFIEWAERLKKEEIPWGWDVFSLSIEGAGEDKRVFSFN